MTNAEIPAASGHIIKIPLQLVPGFGANVVNHELHVGRESVYGRESGWTSEVRRDGKFEFSFTDEQRGEYSQLMLDVDVKGLDWQAYMGAWEWGVLCGNYIQSCHGKSSFGRRRVLFGRKSRREERRRIRGIMVQRRRKRGLRLRKWRQPGCVR